MLNEAGIEAQKRKLLTQQNLLRVLGAIPGLTAEQKRAAIAEWRDIEEGR